MIYCTKCGASLPDDAKFCSKCGTTVSGGGGSAPARPPGAGAAPIAAAGVQEMKCPSCGAPIKPVFGEMVITCDYCGGSVTLGGEGWKEIQKHTLLPLKVPDQKAALKAVHDYLDTGFMHRHVFEESKLEEVRLSYVPFWVIPTSASTTYQYQAAAASIGGTVGTIAAGALLGSALSGNRGGGGFMVMPILGGPVVNPNRSATIANQYEYPVVAVKSMSEYQPKDYTFQLGDRQLFDKKSIPQGSPVLNGDLGEDAAKNVARAAVDQLQSEAVHKKHSMISNIRSQVDISDGELLHVPVWYFSLEKKGEKSIILVDGNAGRVIRTVP
jgi:hypothetical protein